MVNCIKTFVFFLQNNSSTKTQELQLFIQLLQTQICFCHPPTRSPYPRNNYSITVQPIQNQTTTNYVDTASLTSYHRKELHKLSKLKTKMNFEYLQTNPTITSFLFVCKEQCSLQHLDAMVIRVTHNNSAITENW